MEVYKTGGMHAWPKGCSIGGKHVKRDAGQTESRQEGFRTGGMQDRKDARQELGFRTVMVFKGAEPEEAGQNGSRTGGSRTGGSWTKWKQNRRKLDRMEAEPEEAGQNGCRTGRMHIM